MNIRQLSNKVVDKLPPIIFCFAISVFLYIFHQVSEVDKKTFVVPLTVMEEGGVCHTNLLPTAVSVVVRADTNVINTINQNQFKAILNLNEYLDKGEFSVPVKITVDDKLLEFDPLEVKVKPEFITVDVDSKGVKFVKINPTIVGEVAHGYQIESVDVNPAFVEVIGPDSQLANLNYVDTSRVTVTNAVTDFAVDAEYLPVNTLINVVDKGPYKVSLSVVPSVVKQEYKQVSILPLNLTGRLMLKKELDYVDFTLSGNQLVIEKFGPAINTVTVNLAGISEPGEYEVNLDFHIPSDLTIEHKSATKVKVEIVNVPSQTEKEDEADSTAEDAVNSIESELNSDGTIQSKTEKASKADYFLLDGAV